MSLAFEIFYCTNIKENMNEIANSFKTIDFIYH